MDAKTLGTLLSANRVAFGLAFLVAPERSIRGWVGPRTARTGGAQILTRAIGARDVALGAGALAARDDARPWFAGQAISDGADFAATLVAPGIPPASRAFGLVMAGVSTVVAAAAAREGGGG